MTIVIDIASKVDFKPAVSANEINKAWETTSKYLSDLSIKPMGSPDSKKLLSAMTAAKKDLTFVVSFDKDDRITVTAVVNGKPVSIAYEGTISANGKDQKQARLTLAAMAKKGKLYTAAELVAWDKKHPDPDKVAELEKQRSKAISDLAELTRQVSQLQPGITKARADIDRINGQLKTLGVDLK